MFRMQKAQDRKRGAKVSYGSFGWGLGSWNVVKHKMRPCQALSALLGQAELAKVEATRA